MADALLEMMKARLALDEMFEKTWEDWRRECNAKGLEIYYDMSDAKERGVSCDCDEDCEERHTILVGQYKTRPCANHFKGHACNPPRHTRLVGLSA